ncbi:type II restriction/modification system DNA methylase subunit YeeA [Algoriphagus aquaeductus]|uniref:site-specific DNA-methyltransferase (adenine-specific) n=1 Tax=Algoriphagus aquaeductus TaxID=475299 RepID=A0A326RNL9_9BACT|nr:DNA methyltransferase [Algoriphagus aquaeductus]PZV77540.1 type II restriction/modification system DNA methylase subunit YeeA [Algoriphagus aquaeductus]
MALSWNEIKDRALRFTKEWEGESRERAEKDTFWNDFFNVFGISRRRLATFEEPVKKLNNAQGFIDLFWKGTLLVEHKSKGRSLDAAFEQASDYFHGIKEHELPKYVLVSDFENFRLYDLDEKTEHSFHLSDFHKNIKLFGFIAGYQKRSFKDEDEVNIAAAELMGKLHDQLEESGYQGHDLEVYLVRLLFCLFADDTGIFEKDIFKEFIEVKTSEDGSNLGALLAQLFQTLNRPKEARSTMLDEHLNAFPYVNGKLFEEPLMIPSFNSRMREILLLCSALNWGKISPAIFGSMFQSVMDPKERRNLGAHYTSEKNILKLIKPLFLDELWEEFHKIKGNKRQLLEFQMRLGKLKFLDPACGCGNFLIITYREIRLLELEVMKEIYKGQQAIGIQEILCVDVDQFYGIEYDEFPAKIAEVALWLMDHQMNLRVSEEFGLYYARLPLKKSAKIVHGNALRINWEDVVPKEELSFILGNPPFYGKQYQSKVQKEDMAKVFKGVDGAGVLDYVSAWYLKASALIVSSKIRVAFVSTNSISQGEQTGVLWGYLVKNFGVKINFAHQTFNWKNEAKGNAAVHVVIIGFSVLEQNQKKLFIYDNINGDPIEVRVKRINPYLVEGRDVFILKRNNLISPQAPKMIKGSMPNDGGYFLFNEEEKNDFLKTEPNANEWIRKFIGGREFINGISRYCLWLKGINPNQLRAMPEVLKRVELVKDLRLKSDREATRKSAKTPTLFGEDRQPDFDYLALPEVSSERREYIPTEYYTREVIASNKVYMVPNCGLYGFGVLTSKMFMVWIIYVSGRLKSDFSISTGIVYHNFPWPKNPSDKNKALVEEKAQKVIDTRAKYPDSSLADLYDPLLMPADLVRAHQELDRAVDQCYRPQPFTTEMARIEYLFELYEEYLTPLLGKGRKK